MTTINGSPIAEFVRSYQFEMGDEGEMHRPSFFECCMIEDAICSFIADRSLLEAALSQAEQAGGAGQEGTVVFPDEGEQRYWQHPAKGHIWDEEQAQDVADRLRVAYGAGNVAEEAADLIEAMAVLRLSPDPAGVQVKALEWSNFDGPTRNKAWKPDLQELIYTALNYLDGGGDADDDAGEQIVERLLSHLRAAPPAAGAQVKALEQAVDEIKALVVASYKDGRLAKSNLNAAAHKLSDLRAALIAPPAAGAQGVPVAWGDVIAERRRQIEAEGWTADHDDKHTAGELAYAAASYALASRGAIAWVYELIHRLWPWEKAWWKPSKPRRNLVKAAALILAEIERRDRAALIAPPAAGVQTVPAGDDDEISPYEWLAQEFDRLAILRKMWSAYEVAAFLRRHDIARNTAPASVGEER